MRFGVFFLRDLDFGIDDGLLAPSPIASFGRPCGVNEDWTTGVVNDYPNTNWRQANPLGFTTENGAAFEDGMFGEYPGLPAAPQPTCDGNSQPVQHWGQAWRIGSEAIGAGTLVQTDTLQKLIGRTIHTNIVSPPQ
jgi:hypothetical protein